MGVFHEITRSIFFVFFCYGYVDVSAVGMKFYGGPGHVTFV
jgi:hypothetical protein